MPFTITVQPSGSRFSADRDEASLAAAIRQGVGLPYGCKDGACGSCKCRLVSGRVIHGAHQPKALSADEEAAGWTLTCCAAPQTDIVLEARVVALSADYPVRKMPCRVLSITRPADDVAIVRLQLPAGDAFRYRAGQYVDFLLAGNVRRSYSMANAPLWPPVADGAGTDAKPSIELHIRHVPGGRFTEAVFTTMKERDILRIEGPFGSFFLREESTKPIVLLASGTGFAPVKAIVEQMIASGTRRDVRLYWGGRTRADLYLHDWAQQLGTDLPGLVFVPVLSHATEADAWAGRTGFVHAAVMADLPDLSGHQVYACGAPVMVDAAQRDFVVRCGLPAHEFYADAFTTEADKHAA